MQKLGGKNWYCGERVCFPSPPPSPFLPPILNRVNTSEFVLKTKYNAKKSEIENKISDTCGLPKKTDYNTKTTEITNLAIKTVLTTVENKIPNVNSLVKKQIITQKLQKFKINLITMIMINILQLQSSIL